MSQEGLEMLVIPLAFIVFLVVLITTSQTMVGVTTLTLTRVISEDGTDIWSIGRFSCGEEDIEHMVSEYTYHVLNGNIEDEKEFTKTESRMFPPVPQFNITEWEIIDTKLLTTAQEEGIKANHYRGTINTSYYRVTCKFYWHRTDIRINDEFNTSNDWYHLEEIRAWND